MTYRFLSDEQADHIARQKMLELEAEHARLTLDLRLADVADIDNDNVAQARDHLTILVVQMAALDAWTGGSADGEGEPSQPS